MGLESGLWPSSARIITGLGSGTEQWGPLNLIAERSASLDQQIADNAQAATGARLVHFAWLDAISREVRVGAMSGPHPAVVQQALAAAQRFFPSFDPLLHVRFPVDVNRWNASVYSGGGALLATFEQIVEGTVPPLVASIARRVAGLQYTFTCPLMQENEVVGSLAFHFGGLPTEAQQRTCEAFARQAALTLENARLREQTARVLGAVSDAVVETDAARRVTFVNPAAVALFARRAGDLLGQPLADLVDTISSTTGTVARPDGTSVPVDYSSTAVPTGQVLVLRDSRARIEAERSRAALARAERLRALGQMASGIAHDLNQALALITGYAQLARDGLEHTSATAELRGHLEVVANAAHDSAQAVRRLLSWARSSDVPPIGAVDARQLLDEVAQLTAPRWRDLTQTEGRPVELVVEASQPAVLEGDPASLREALRNLVFNSVDALVTGGTIALRARATADEVTLEVADTGPGIPPDIRSRIFDPFFTTKGESGTGLGLAQVMATAEQHHGRLELESESGDGTTFRLVLPAAAPREIVDAQTVSTAAPERAGRSLRILAVDDEERLARLAAHILSSSGHRVSVATSGEEALKLIAQEPVDLVDSDLGMGAGINGWELAEQVRQRHPGIRVILATGWGAAISDREAAAHNVDAVVAKPYRPAQLRELVARLAADGGTARMSDQTD